MAGALPSATVLIEGPAGAPLVPVGFDPAGVVSATSAPGSGSTSGAESTGATGTGAAGTGTTAPGITGAAGGGGGIGTTGLVIGGVVAAGAGIGIAVAGGGSDSGGGSTGTGGGGTAGGGGGTTPPPCTPGPVTASLTNIAPATRCGQRFSNGVSVSNGSCAAITIQSIQLTQNAAPGPFCSALVTQSSYVPAVTSVAAGQTVTVLNFQSNVFCCAAGPCPGTTTCGYDETFVVQASAGALPAGTIRCRCRSIRPALRAPERMICPSCGAPNPDDGVACFECGTPTLSLPAMGPGFVLASRYEILRILGRGGMGMVYQAHDRLLEETVAIKVLRPDAAGSPEIQARFRAEIKMARAVSHKNVCRIHEYGEDRGIRYISMAYVDGIDLKQVLRQQGPLPPGEAFEVVIRVADALQAIHDEGIIHRDLKTPNIMVDSKSVVRLMDFGIAKQDQGDGLSMTVTGQIIGTPEYMSPEQVQAQQLDGRSDVYSLGIVVFEVFTGATPFRADTPLGTVLKHLNEPPPLEGPQATLLPAAVVPVLRKALAKRREERYASAREMAQALEAARAATPGATDRVARTARAATIPGAGETLVPTLDQATTAAPPAAAAATTQLSPRRQSPRLLWVWIAAGLATAVVLAAAVAWLPRRPAPPAPVASGLQPPSPEPQPPAAPAEPQPAAATTGPPPSAPAAAPGRGRTVSEARAAQALAGQLAAPKIPAAESALGRGDPDVAPRDVDAAARADAALERLLTEGERALEAQSFDTAIARYDEALKLDPRNALARMGRTTAVSARVARAPVARTPAKASFVAERTAAESVETRPDSALANAFEESPTIPVTRDTQPALLPGRIEFKTEPATVGPGERYKLEVRFVNTGSAPIEIKDMLVTTTVNGRKSGGPVPPSVSTVAPGQGSAVLSVSDTLREDLRSWSIEIVLRTSRGESYRNRLVWTAAAALDAAR